MFIDLPPAPMTGRDDDWTEFSVEDASRFYHGLATPEGHKDIVTWYTKEIMMARDPSPEDLHWVPPYVKVGTTRNQGVASGLKEKENIHIIG